MSALSNIQAWPRKLSLVWLGLSLSATFGCAAAEESSAADEQIGQIQQPITGGWEELDLNDGWSSYSGATNPPAIGVVDGIVTFRGALSATTNADESPFTLPEEFRPPILSSFKLRVSHSGGVGGTLYINAQQDASGEAYTAGIIQDGQSGMGQAARTLTSLDGVSFDQAVGTALNWHNYWSELYPFRVSGPLMGGTWVKNVDGFVRFQGYLKRGDPSSGYQQYVFNLPSQYRTNQSVFVPVNLEGSWGELAIYPNGNVYVRGNPPAAAAGTSFEGAFYSRTTQGNEQLDLENGWENHSARAARVGMYDGVVRFQGAISGGTSATFATLPSSMRPSVTLFLVAAAYGSVPARIFVTPNGNVRVDTNSLPLSVATNFLSLDGISFGL